ncbi:hypothetical protein QJS10_CPB13g01327 [Acorus calamus]|uniref:Uncharacterized protein n=1 Tax=Acorus calamus TaxID=4465 RepID=A0AAV9DHP0_ACOCL|nr:hypothetical protein QJS10_CPB13g01327 [Acorus calamus]
MAEVKHHHHLFHHKKDKGELAEVDYAREEKHHKHLGCRRLCTAREASVEERSQECAQAQDQVGNRDSRGSRQRRLCLP